tara:strand:+ start:2277 stop:2501 length:225 start_codon:yes stop_codon:yes gene_type:complete
MTITETLQRMLDENTYSLAVNQGKLIAAKAQLVKTRTTDLWLESLQDKEQRLKEERSAFIEALASIETIKTLTL